MRQPAVFDVALHAILRQSFKEGMQSRIVPKHDKRTGHGSTDTSEPYFEPPVGPIIEEHNNA